MRALRSENADALGGSRLVRTVRRTSGTIEARSGSGRRLRGAALVGLLVLIAGCPRALVLDVPPPGPDELQYAGTLVYRRGVLGLELLRIDDGGLLRAGEPLVTRTASGSRSLVVWTIDRRSFVHPDGRPMSAAEFETLVIRAAATPSSPDRGTCGRCLVPNAGKAPLVVHSGTSCAPPRDGVKVAIDARSPHLNDELRVLAVEAVRMEWAGGCACTLASLSSDAPVRARVLDAPVRSHRVRIATASGALALVDDLGGVRVDGGRVQELRPLPEGLGMTGVAMGGGPEPELLAAVLRGRLRFELLWYQYDRASDMWLERFVLPSFQPHDARATPGQPGEFMVMGHLRDVQKLAVVYVCSAQARGCAELVNSTSGIMDESFGYATKLADGGLVFGTDGGDVVYVDRIPALSSARGAAPSVDARSATSAGERLIGRTGRAPDVARWAAYGLTRVATSSAGVLPVSGLHGLASVGQRMYACLTNDAAEPSERRILIVSRELSPRALDLTSEGPNLGLRVEACRPYADGLCRGLVTTGTVVHALFDRGDGYEVLSFDRDGPLDPAALRTPECRPTVGDPGPRGPVVRFAHQRFGRVQQVSDDAWIGVLTSGDVLRVDGSGRRWLYGDGAPRPEWTAAVSDEAGGAWLLGPAGLVGRWSESVGLVTTAVAGLPAVRAAALDHSEPGPAVGFVVITADGRAVRLSVDLAAGRGGVDVLHDPRPDANGVRFEAVQVVEAVPGVHVAIAGGAGQDLAEIWRLRRGAEAEVTRDFGEDPRTTELDPAPYSDKACAFAPRSADLGLTGTGQRALRSLASSHGVVWAAGCGGELYRIIAGTRGLQIERHAPKRWGFRPAAPMTLGTVTAVCPDQLVLGAEEDTTSGSTGRVRILGVVPSGTPEALSRLDQDVTVIEGLGTEPREGLVDRGAAHAVYVGGRIAVIVLSGGDGDDVRGTIGRLGAARGSYLAEAPLTSVRVAGDKVLVALRGGTLVLAEPAP